MIRGQIKASPLLIISSLKHAFLAFGGLEKLDVDVQAQRRRRRRRRRLSLLLQQQSSVADY